MSQTNRYWLGQQQAKISDTDGWVSAKWGKGDNAGNKLRMINGAFEIYFLLKRSIGQCADPALKELMTKELDDAATEGMGVGVCDLDDAFEHWLQAGPWRDNNEKTYMRVNGIFGTAKPAIKGAEFCWGLASNAMPGPQAAVEFFNSLDGKMDDLSGAIRGHNSEVAQLVSAVSSKQSARTGDILHNVAKFANVAKKFLFLAPNPNDKFLTDVFTGSAATASPSSRAGYYTPFTDLNAPSPITGKASPPVRESNLDVLGGKAALTFLQAILDVDTFLSVHKNALRTGIFDNRTSTAFAALTVALGKVPILGSFYAEIVKNLPGFFAGMQNLFEEHYRTIDRMTRVN
jgi:hypothetical protein